MDNVNATTEKLWSNSYGEFVKREIEIPDNLTLLDFFDNAYKQYSRRYAIENMGTYLSYKQLDELSKDFVSYIQNHTNLKPGDRFAIQLPNMLQYPVAILGLIRAGIIIVNLNPLYTPHEMEKHLQDSGAKGILILENFACNLSQITKKCLSLETILVSKPGDLQGFFKGAVINLVAKYIKKMIPQYDLRSFTFFSTALQLGSKSKYFIPRISSSDTALIQYTGGTTGVLKGAVITHKNLVANIMQIDEWAQGFIKKGEEVSLTALPLYHIFSFTVNFLFGLHYGKTMHLISNPREADKMLRHIADKKITFMTGLDTLYKAMINNKEFKPEIFANIKLAISAGVKLSSKVYDSWLKLNINLLECYGLTETSPAAVLNPFQQGFKKGSVGLPISNTFIKIIDELGHEQPLSASGEILIKGPQVIKEYYNNPLESENAIKDGWLYTGDIGFIDKDGFLIIQDRKKELINISGLKIFPGEVEEIVQQLDGVLECAVVGMTTEERERAVLFVVKKAEKSINAETIILHCKQFLTNYKIPSEIIFIDSLPKSTVGKVLKRELKLEKPDKDFPS